MTDPHAPAPAPDPDPEPAPAPHGVRSRPGAPGRYPREAVVSPAADPFVARSTELHHGPIARMARTGTAALPVAWVLSIVATVTYALGYLIERACHRNTWTGPDVYEHLCYTDIVPLYSLRGLAEGIVPYVQSLADVQPLEYPVLTGVFAYVAATITGALSPILTALGWPSPVHVFYDVNVALLGVALLVTIVATAFTVRRRPWDALLIAGSPIVLLVGTINWDLLAMAATAAALLAWSRRAVIPAGILLGIAIAVKFYPAVMLGAFVVLAIRTGRWRPVATLMIAAAGTWVAVNAAVAIAAGQDWWYFYAFSGERGQDLGSVWLGSTLMGFPSVPAQALNIVATTALLVACAAIAYLVLTAPRRPRLVQVLFLVMAAFVLTNKVYSPQYALWLLPLAVLARPRWSDQIVWQAGQVIYIVAVWWYLVGTTNMEADGLPPALYGMAICVHALATVFLAGQVIRDIRYPSHDPVRSDGFAEDADDPSGGVFDAAEDRFVLRRPQQDQPVTVETRVTAG